MRMGMRRVFLRADAVEKLMSRRNLSLSDIAREAGLSKGFLSQAMHGSRCPGPASRRRLQAALGIDKWDVLFRMEGERRQP